MMTYQQFAALDEPHQRSVLLDLADEIDADKGAGFPISIKRDRLEGLFAIYISGKVPNGETRLPDNDLCLITPSPSQLSLPSASLLPSPGPDGATDAADIEGP